MIKPFSHRSQLQEEMTMPNTHPSLPHFELIQPATLKESSQFLTQHPEDARPFLGGTDIFVRLRDGHLKLNTLVNIKNIPGMDTLSFNPQTGLTIGSAVSMNRVIIFPEVQVHYPLLVEAARSVASYQLRNRATIVGNICNASPAGDSSGASLIYKGELNVYSANGERQIPLEDFFLGPGKTALKPGEIVTSIHFPLPPQGHQCKYLKLGRNVISDLSIVGVAVLGYADETAKSKFRFRIALASVAPVPLIARDAEELLASQPLSDAVITKAAEAAMNACHPIDDVRSSAVYRQAMVFRLTYRAVSEVWQRLQMKAKS
jgi:CO/xanthine dehydrogenase FAD-binding subunit